MLFPTNPVQQILLSPHSDRLKLCYAVQPTSNPLLTCQQSISPLQPTLTPPSGEGFTTVRTRLSSPVSTLSPPSGTLSPPSAES